MAHDPVWRVGDKFKAKALENAKKYAPTTEAEMETASAIVASDTVDDRNCTEDQLHWDTARAIAMEYWRSKLDEIKSRIGKSGLL